MNKIQQDYEKLSPKKQILKIFINNIPSIRTIEDIQIIFYDLKNYITFNSVNDFKIK